MAKRSKVELFEQIRRAAEIEELSIHALAGRFGVHRRTIRQALIAAVPPAHRYPQRAAPVLDRWKPVIDAWLEEDKSAPRKQRHTARRVFQRLVDEHGAQISETTVRRYVAQAKGRHPIPLPEVMIPQDHPLGYEAEVDFGQIGFHLNGELVEAWMFVMRLSASGKGFHRIYLNQAQEAFIDGHVRGFEWFGGVPVRVRYDNLKPAVARVLMGRNRSETERFVALRSHYLFEAFYCRPGKDGAHEKGGVEGEVGRFRRRHMVPVPRVSSMAELNALVRQGDVLDDLRHVDARRHSVGAHFAAEAAHLRALPSEPFDVALLLRPRADTKSRVAVRQCFYSVPVRFAGRRIDVRLLADRVEALEGARVVASHERAVTKGTQVLDLDHYLEVLSIKPGGFCGSSALAQARAQGRFTPAHQAFYDHACRQLGERDGTRAMIEVLLAHRIFSHDVVVAGIERALLVKSCDPDVVILEARRAAQRDLHAPSVEGLSRFDRPVPSLSPYDDLLEAAP